jgi:hypothetical protein
MNLDHHHDSSAELKFSVSGDHMNEVMAVHKTGISDYFQSRARSAY